MLAPQQESGERDAGRRPDRRRIAGRNGEQEPQHAGAEIADGEGGDLAQAAEGPAAPAGVKPLRIASQGTLAHGSDTPVEQEDLACHRRPGAAAERAPEMT